MADTVGSRYLTDAGVQLESTAATLASVIEVNGNPAIGDSVTIFLPKEVIPSGTEDVTLTLEIVNAISGGVVEKKHNRNKRRRYTCYNCNYY
jgi:hypothetical protein